MANIKSAKKRIKVIETKTLRNKMLKSSLKTIIKNFLTSVEGKNYDEAKVAYEKAARALDMSVTKGILHKNKAARTKSRLAAKLNALNA
ncbi:30S ribosomal protein S20 [Clostridium niameyense]|uniref:Small ribosomal subunit protein bS20 n=1 Tax=Clostridium niameyense TaxID=1622073 RepID=A0A6M0R698_9CLOT|nr:30S ribosomal protein S20 [Clostridium niameyense]NEZ45693.1 30S ribosomal protein S20 [Clostridium niameyense]